ncbi:hypothetical protein ACLD5S_01845 [Gardnerella vaginalis]|uniref:hypothetical protein n=1 Tax=Gardnerella vaginalis TaxID=2702 RepID=UPI00397076F1
MMNKKAIAAFAAGATLLAGFAMATPAFAAEGTAAKTADTKVDPAKLKEAKDKVAKAEREVTKDTVALEEAQEAANNAEVVLANVKAAKDAADKAKAEQDKTTAADTKDNYSANQKKKIDEAKDAADKALQEALKKAKADLNDANDFADYEAVKTKVSGIKAAVFSVKVTLEEAKATLTEAKAALAKLVGGETPAPAPTPDHTNPVVPGVHVKAADKAKAVEAVKTAKLHLDAALAAYTKDYAEYEKAKATLAGKVAAQEAAEKALKAAQDALEAYNVSAKNDSALGQRLADAVDRAQAKVVFAVAETAKANKDYAEAKAKAVASTAKYNAALAEYKACYNDAETFGVEASQLPPVVTSDPLAPNFEDVPGAAKAMNDAASGKLGKAAQQEAAKNAPAANKAAAKGELSAKGGNGHGGKAGEKLGNAGVGVALTALAASMLAGMGAAVRKMRH